jgi:hypothetical protein
VVEDKVWICAKGFFRKQTRGHIRASDRTRSGNVGFVVLTSCLRQKREQAARLIDLDPGVSSPPQKPQRFFEVAFCARTEFLSGMAACVGPGTSIQIQVSVLLSEEEKLK